MKVHTIDRVSLQSAAQVADTIGIVHDQADASRIVVVVDSLARVADQLYDAAVGAAAGATDHQASLRAIEERHFEVVRRTVGLKRQSGVVASVRQQFNLLEDVLASIALIRELSPRTLDMVLAHGEWLSAFIFCAGLRERRPDARFVDARQVLLTDRQFTQAKVRLAESRDRKGRLFDGGHAWCRRHLRPRGHRRRRQHDLRPRGEQIRGVGAGGGAWCRGGGDLDGHGRDHDRRPAQGPVGQDDSVDVVRRSDRDDALRR